MMKITGTTQIVKAYQKNVQPAKLRSNSLVDQQDTMEVSSDARSFSEIMQAARAELMQPASPERLSVLEQSIGAGTYGVNAQELAGRILLSI